MYVQKGEDSHMNIGHKISLCRKKSGISQEVLANKLKISRQAVSRWETGEAVPDTEKIIQLSRIFNVSTDYLLLDEIEEQRETERKVNAQTDFAKEKRRHLRICVGMVFFVIGLAALIGSLAGAVIYADSLTEWYSHWGKYGTALFRTWMIVPLILSISLSIAGGSILWREYCKEN